MTVRARLLAGAALCATMIAAPLVGGATPARAADPSAITAQGAAKVGEALRFMVAGFVESTADAPAVRVTPEGDHYALVIPMPGALPKDGKATPALTATAKPLDGDAFSVSDMAFPSPITRELPRRSPDGAALPPRTAVMAVDKQQGGGRVDPSFATPTAMDLDWTGLTVTQADPDLATAFKAEDLAIHVGVSPIVDGHVDFVEQAKGNHLLSESTIGGKPGVHAAMDKLMMALTATGVDPTKVRPAMSAFAHFVATLQPTDANGGKAPSLDKMTDTQRHELHDTIELLRGFASGGKMDASIDNIGTVTPDGQNVTLANFAFGLGAQTHEAKTIDVSTSFGLDGIAAPAIPPQFETVVPRHLVLKISAPGLDLATLTRMSLDATATPPVSPSDGDAEKLFGGGGAKLVLDGFGMELGGATLASTGALTVKYPSGVTGHAHITATGFDALNTLVQTTPGLTPGLAVLGVIRSFARPDPDAPKDSGQLMWNIDYDGAKVLINGIDASAMIPGAGGGSTDSPDKPTPSHRPSKPGAQSPTKR